MVSAFGIRKHVLVAISVYLYFTALVFGNVNNRSDTFRNGGNKSSKVKTNVNVRSTSQRSYVEREQDSSKTTGSVEDSSEEQFEHDVDTSKEQVAESIIFDSDNTCSRSCLEKEERKKVTVEAIKKNILTKLGLERPPEISTKHRHNGRVVRQMLRNGLMKPILMKEAEMQGDEPFYEPEEEDLQWKGFDTEGDDFHVFPKTVFALAHTAPECRGWDTIYDFTFSKETMRAKVSKAQIWIYLRGAKYYNLTEVMYWNATTSLWGQDYYHYNTSSEGQEYFNTTTTRGGPHHVSHHLLPHERRQGGNVTRTDPVVDVAVRVKWLYRLPDGSHKTVSVSSSKQQLPQGEGGWIQINVTEFVSYWFSSFTSSLMSVVEVLDSLDDKMTLTEEAEQLTEVPPILEVSAVKRRHRRRSRRSLGMDCDGTKDEKRCCRYPLTVDFEKFGWDWIIAPKKYEANDCSGECPYVFLQKYPYTHIASMENKTICCAPRKMSSISMLYFDKDSNILLSTLPGMVVETCGCF